MFFRLSKAPDNRFSSHFALGNLVLSTDAGWHKQDRQGHVYVYKGYMDTVLLEENLHLISCQPCTGNFCIFDYEIGTGIISVRTDHWRSFVMWANAQGLTNLVADGRPIWADSEITIDQDLFLIENKIDIIGRIETSPVSSNQLIDLVHQSLTSRIRSFLSQSRLPIRIFCSGGIDSMLVFSYIKANTDRFEIVFNQHIEWDEFWCKNQAHIRQTFWGYQQIHHWTMPCYLSSGAPGDEFMLRSPTTSNLWLKHHGTSILSELDKGKTDRLHRDYFLRKKHLKLFAEQQQDGSLDQMTTQQVMHHLCNIVVNDFQHWHIGNTLTFTPLRDLEMFKLFLRLPLQDAIEQILDSEISKQLIARNDANLLNYLSDSKNSDEVLSNLVGLMSKYSAISGQ